jgi:CubicO group peptidase (beta-lactamase class C family)
MRAADPREAGFDPGRLALLGEAIDDDIEAERYDGCEVVVARGGVVAYHGTHGWADRAARRRVERGQPFITMSIGKQLTVALVLRCVEEGYFALTTPVADVIPEFGARGKARVTIAHLLTHTGGLPMMLPEGLAPEQAGNLEAMVAAVSGTLLECLPGDARDLQRARRPRRAGRAGAAGHRRRPPVSSGDARRALRAARHARHVARPAARIADRVAPVVARDRRVGLFDPAFMEAMGAIIGEEARSPPGGYVSTAPDFTASPRCSARRHARRLPRLSPPPSPWCRRTAPAISRTRSGPTPRRCAAGRRSPPASATGSSCARGHPPHAVRPPRVAPPRSAASAAGSSAFWVDPERDVTYAFLSAGLMEDSYSIDRHQRLADIVHAAAV